MENPGKSTHPLVLVAAAAVTIASLAAAAYFTGFIPNRSSEPATATAVAPPPAAVAQTETPPPPVETRKPEARPHVQHRAAEPARRGRDNDDWRYQSGSQRVATNNVGVDAAPSAQSAAPTPPVCRECGTVENVHEVTVKADGSGLGAVAGGVLGGVLGHQVGRGTGRDLATIAGAVGGAFAGNQVEKTVRADKQYELTVRFDDGSVRTYTQGGTGWQVGERVRLANGSLSPL